MTSAQIGWQTDHRTKPRIRRGNVNTQVNKRHSTVPQKVLPKYTWARPWSSNYMFWPNCQCEAQFYWLSFSLIGILNWWKSGIKQIIMFKMKTIIIIIKVAPVSIFKLITDEMRMCNLQMQKEAVVNLSHTTHPANWWGKCIYQMEVLWELETMAPIHPY